MHAHAHTHACSFGDHHHRPAAVLAADLASAGRRASSRKGRLRRELAEDDPPPASVKAPVRAGLLGTSLCYTTASTDPAEIDRQNAADLQAALANSLEDVGQPFGADLITVHGITRRSSRDFHIFSGAQQAHQRSGRACCAVFVLVQCR